MIAKTRDGDDLVKVVDFGIAKATGNERAESDEDRESSSGRRTT